MTDVVTVLWVPLVWQYYKYNCYSDGFITSLLLYSLSVSCHDSDGPFKLQRRLPWLWFRLCDHWRGLPVGCMWCKVLRTCVTVVCFVYTFLSFSQLVWLPCAPPGHIRVIRTDSSSHSEILTTRSPSLSLHLSDLLWRLKLDKSLRYLTDISLCSGGMFSVSGSDRKYILKLIL